MSPTAVAGIPATMRAMVLGADGELALERIPVPAPRRGEALIRVAACGVCHSDLHVAKGEIAFPAPCVLGHEFSGTVVALGPGTAQRFAAGDQVVGGFIMPCEACDACAAGRDDLCRSFFELNRLGGTLYDGESRLARAGGEPLAMYSMAAMADYCVVPIGALTRLPASLPVAESAILGCAAMTAYGAVTRTAGLQPGATAAVVGTGGIGMSMLQIAAGLGARTLIAVDITAEKLALARELGATHTVDASREDPVAAVRRLTGGSGVELAFEALGRAETLEQAVGMLGDGGRAVAVGLAPAGVRASVEITPLVRRGQGILGSYGARTRIDLPAVVALAERGGFDVSAGVTSSYPLTEAAQAFADLAARRIVGRAVLRME